MDWRRLSFARTRVPGTSFVLLSVLLILSSMASADCQVAHPQFGVIKCKVDTDAQPAYPKLTFSCSGNYCNATMFCSGRCELDKSQIKLICPALSKTLWDVYRSGTKVADSGGFSSGGMGTWPLQFYDQEQISIKAWCSYLVTESPIDASSSYVTVTFWDKYLYETTPDWPEHKAEGTSACAPQSWITKYVSQSVSSGVVPGQWVDSSGALKDSVAAHPNLQQNVQSLQANMKINEYYSYFHKWITVPDINVVYGKSGNPVGYCGGSVGSRKLFSYSTVTTIGGSCYLIPTSVQQSVQCCANEDCNYAPSTPVCDPTTFTCSSQRPCNSDVECQVPGQTASCENKQETSWHCDLSQKWYPFLGTCAKTVTPVRCCSDSECGFEEYCNKEKGCTAKYIISECPSGKCCKPGGKYKEKACDSGLICCQAADPIIGDCKSTCEEPKPAIDLDALASSIDPNDIAKVLGKDSSGGFNVPIQIGPLKVNVPVGSNYKQAAKDLDAGFPVMGTLIKTGVREFACPMAAAGATAAAVEFLGPLAPAAGAVVNQGCRSVLS